MSETALELLKTLVSIPSINPFKYFAASNGSGYYGLGTEENINLYLEQYLIDAGFEVSRQILHGRQVLDIKGSIVEIPERWNLLATRYPKNKWNGKSILLTGHTDTVDVKQGWASDPFIITAQKSNDLERWYGLGSNDMKGGLAAILDAAKFAVSAEYALKIALVVDEEFYSFGAEALRESSFLDDVVFAIAPEIGDTLSSADKPGHLLIGIGRTGRIEFDVNVAGVACHGADAFLSRTMVNAVHESAKLQSALIEDFKQVYRCFSQNGAECVNSAYISYQIGGEPMLSVPDSASFIIDRTFLPDESPDTELIRLRDFVDQLKREGGIDPRSHVTISARPRPTPPCKPYITSLDTPEIQRMLEVIKTLTPSYSYYIGRSVADENRIAMRGIPILTIGPTGAGSHTNQEWVDPASVTQVNRIFREYIASL